MSATMRIETLESLALSPTAALLAAEGSLLLQQQGFTRWPAYSWDTKALVAFDSGDTCLGLIAYSIDEKLRLFDIDFAHVPEGHPFVLTGLLKAAKRTALAAGCERIRFSHHVGNSKMEKIGKAIGAQPNTISYKVPIR